jgi:hypothetical protein
VLAHALQVRLVVVHDEVAALGWHDAKLRAAVLISSGGRCNKADAWPTDTRLGTVVVVIRSILIVWWSIAKPVNGLPRIVERLNDVAILLPASFADAEADN